MKKSILFHIKILLKILSNIKDSLPSINYKKNSSPYRLMVRTLPFHGKNAGSIPTKDIYC